jgi:hypothetical protein
MKDVLWCLSSLSLYQDILQSPIKLGRKNLRLIV